jgi:hypothetical protein
MRTRAAAEQSPSAVAPDFPPLSRVAFSSPFLSLLSYFVMDSGQKQKGVRSSSSPPPSSSSSSSGSVNQPPTSRRQT